MKIYIPIWIDLKVDLSCCLQLSDRIYIPIWIDLKDLLHSLFQYQAAHLHSNMDRFERSFCNRRPACVSEIYIPIWIDLKAVATLRFSRRFRSFTFQYG